MLSLPTSQTTPNTSEFNSSMSSPEPSSITTSSKLKSLERDIVNEECASKYIRRSIIQTSKDIGFEKATEEAMIELERHAIYCIESLARMSMEYTQNNYRTQPTAKDVYEAFEDVGMTAEDLLPIINTNNEQISNSNFNTIPPSENMDELDQFKDPTDDFLPSDDEDDNNNGNEHVQAHQEAMVRMLELAPPFVPKMPPRHAYHRTPVYPTPHRTRTPIAHLDRKQNTSRLVERALKSLIERTQVATESSLINKNNEALKDNQNDDVENANTPLPTTNENSNNNNNNQGEENGVNKKRISEKPPWLNNINIDQNIIKELPLEFGTVNWAVIGSTQANSNSNNEPNLISSDIDSTNGNNHEIRVKRRRWKV